MREIYELKEKIMGELKKYAAKPELSAASLDTIDKLAHAAKNLEKIMEEGGDYSGTYYSGTRGRGSNAQRDSMGRYSSEGRDRGGDYTIRGRYSSGADYSMHNPGMIEELREVMDETQDPRMRQKIGHLINRMETERP